MANSWETTGGVTEYLNTLKRILTEPTAFFDECDTSDAIARPLVFAVITLVIGGMGNAFWSLIGGVIQIAMQHNFMGMPFKQDEVVTGMIFNIVASVSSPVSGVIGIFVWGAILHLLLTLFGSGSGGYMVTVRVLCYSTASYVTFLVPVCGSFIGGIWSLVLEVIGLMRMHKSPLGPVLAAVLTPILLCCCCIFIVAFFFGVAIAAALPQFIEMMKQAQTGAI